uniref:Uncharacterized protein n=1 Tax=Leptobrachium leishanense TaxID=445787 RepID=A0A8C5MQ12_9ANUR
TSSLVFLDHSLDFTMFPPLPCPDSLRLPSSAVSRSLSPLCRVPIPQSPLLYPDPSAPSAVSRSLSPLCRVPIPQSPLPSPSAVCVPIPHPLCRLPIPQSPLPSSDPSVPSAVFRSLSPLCRLPIPQSPLPCPDPSVPSAVPTLSVPLCPVFHAFLQPLAEA